MGKGKILLKFTYVKLLSLCKVLYVPFHCRNLVFGTLLNTAEAKTAGGDEKVVISHNGFFVGKRIPKWEFVCTLSYF